MPQATKKVLPLPFKIQMFAEDGNNANNDPNGSQYSDEDYKKLNEEHLKLKNSFDKTSSELAELKKQLKSKQTDEEKKAEEEKSRQQEVESLKKEIITYKIKTNLAETFSKEEIEKLTQCIIEGDSEKLVNSLVEIRKAYKEQIYAEAKKEFSNSAVIPGGNGNADVLDKDVQDYIDNKGNGTRATAKNYWFGNQNNKN